MDPSALVLGGGAIAHAVSKTAPIVVDKIADALTGLAAPYQLERIAHAEAKAAIIRKRAEAIGNIEAMELYELAGYRVAAENIKQQLNIQAVTKGIIPLITDSARPQEMDDDWIVHLFSKARLTSDKEMQFLWSRILAGEANTPGTFSKRTLNVVSEISKTEAESFTSICRFCIGEFLLIFDFDDSIYKNIGIGFPLVSQLEQAGLITYSSSMEYRLEHLPQYLYLRYFDRAVQLTLSDSNENNLTVGRVRLTQSGKELAAICGAEEISDFIPYICKKWCQFGAYELPPTFPAIHALKMFTGTPVSQQVYTI